MKKLLLTFLTGFLSVHGMAQCVFQELSTNPMELISSSNTAVPALADIDGDGDLDVFVGQNNSNTMLFYENTGNSTSPVYEQKTGSENPLDNYTNSNVGNGPSLVDIDDDGDLDAFVGIWVNKVLYYENTGTKMAPAFTRRDGDDNPLDTVLMTNVRVYPAFMDMDGDMDYDAIVTAEGGELKYYENVGTKQVPSFKPNEIANPLSGVELSNNMKITFFDVDGDGLKDALIGEANTNTLHYYHNDGTVNSPVFNEVETGSPFEFVNESVIVPQIGDLDGDGKVELVVGISSDVVVYGQFVNIPDANFKAALVADDNIDTDFDDKISCAEAEALTSTINIEGLDISSLSGIEAFVNFGGLKAKNNNLTSIDLSANTKLLSIDVSDNNLTTLDLSNNPLLKTLRFGNNENLSSLNLSNNPSLETLIGSKNKIPSLDLSNNTALIYLWISTNATTYDLSNNILLQDIRMAGGKLESLDLSMLPLLTVISIESNELINLNVKNGENTNITTFTASFNPDLDCIQVDDVDYSETNWTVIDEGVIFSTDCSLENSISKVDILERSLYPNPSSGDLYIETQINTSYKVMNLFGQEVLHGELNTGTNQINVQALEDGVYYLVPEGAKTYRFVKH